MQNKKEEVRLYFLAFDSSLYQGFKEYEMKNAEGQKRNEIWNEKSWKKLLIRHSRRDYWRFPDSERKDIAGAFHGMTSRLLFTKETSESH